METRKWKDLNNNVFIRVCLKDGLLDKFYDKDVNLSNPARLNELGNYFLTYFSTLSPLNS